MTAPSEPLRLEANLITHFYPGGGAIAAFRGMQPEPSPSPEDWVGSTTARAGQSPIGLSRLAGGGLLVDAVEADPVGFLGPEHVEAFGSNTALLVKLLDSSIRLIVHAHPDRDFARQHLGCAHGKTEAWVVLSEKPGDVFVGFRREVGEAELAEWVAEQRVEEMLASLNVLEVSRGDSVLVPAGVPHAVGPGVFFVELQEPTDYSIGLENRRLGQPDLGLGWPVVLGAIDRSAWDPARLTGLRGPGLAAAGRVLPAAADPFFRAELSRGLATPAGAGPSSSTVPTEFASGEDELGTGFAVLVVLAGNGELLTDSDALGVHAGQTLLLPYAAGAARLRGDALVLACRPPPPGPLEPSRPVL
jgi:mannose-6-phosphate isomerase